MGHDGDYPDPILGSSRDIGAPAMRAVPVTERNLGYLSITAGVPHDIYVLLHEEARHLGISNAEFLRRLVLTYFGRGHVDEP